MAAGREVLDGVRWGKLASIVRQRLAAIGKGGPGHCLWSSVVGAAELNKALTGSGTQVWVQAGSVSWRRVPYSVWLARGDKFPDGFSYLFNLSDPTSLRALEGGHMPEYHAWNVVRTPDGVIRVVDFAAHYFPAIVRGEMADAEVVMDDCGNRVPTEKVGMPWEMPDPSNPEVIDPADFGEREEGGGIKRCFYSVDPVATFAALAMASNSLWRTEDGLPDCLRRHYDDLWAALGSRVPNDSWLARHDLKPMTVFAAAASHVRQNPQAFRMYH